jgi:hypothetical protein
MFSALIGQNGITIGMGERLSLSVSFLLLITVGEVGERINCLRMQKKEN